jgi:carbamoyltransferase
MLPWFLFSSILSDASNSLINNTHLIGKVYLIREGKRGLIPAVTHVDGSGRLQTVYRRTNLRYWRLIEAFRAKTGVPMVLNTSFNENEPVVCRPEEALDCFLRTQMDVFVLGNYLVLRTIHDAAS